MKQYQELMQQILEYGTQTANRTGIDTLSLFGEQIRFDLREGFPLVTTKKTHMHSIIHELLWMLSGSTNVEYLQANGVSIWDEWASADYRPEMRYAEGELGPVYGRQWRNWPGSTSLQQDGKTVRVGGEVDIGPGKFALVTYQIDQIANIIDTLRRNPEDRRIILSAWNVADLPKMKLPPCHCFAQFAMRSGDLFCHMYIRSWDFFLGGPFNIAQYALLTHMLAQVTGLGVGELIISTGDVHLYTNHIEQAKLQLTRDPKPLPTLWLNPDIKEIDDFKFEDIAVKGYESHAGIRAKVAI